MQEISAAHQRWCERLSQAWGHDPLPILDWLTGQQPAPLHHLLWLTREQEEDTSLRLQEATAEWLASPPDLPYTSGAAVTALLLAGMLEAKEHFDALRKDLRARWQATPEAAAGEADLGTRICGPHSAYRPIDIQASKWARKFPPPAPADWEHWQRHILSHPDHGIAAPGMSRHGWATEFDIGRIDNQAFAPSGPLHLHFRYLQESAWRRGFFRPFKGLDDLPWAWREACQVKHGSCIVVVEERWHWSYYPLAQAFWWLINQHWEAYLAHLRAAMTHHFPPPTPMALDRRISWIWHHLDVLHHGISLRFEGLSP